MKYFCVYQKKILPLQKISICTLYMLVLIILWLVFSIFVATIAKRKGRNAFGWFILSIIISPILSIIAVVALGDTDELYEEKVIREASYAKTIEEPIVDIKKQEDAIAELKKAKDLLDLAIITQEEYDAKKAELLPIIKPSNVQTTFKKDMPVEKGEKKSVEKISSETSEQHEQKGTSFYIVLGMLLLIAGLIVIVGVVSNNKFNNAISTNATSNTEDYSDNSEKHRNEVKDLFLEALYKDDSYLTGNSYLKSHGCEKNCIIDYDSIIKCYRICICYDITRMKELRHEIYKGIVRVSPEGSSVLVDKVYRANSVDNDSTGLIGRWLISNKFYQGTHEVVIKREGSKYYAYEFGEKKELSKKGYKYYEIGNNAGEYYNIYSTSLRLGDNDGDFTESSGYIITPLP